MAGFGYYPTQEGQVPIWGGAFNTYLGANAAALGVLPADAADIATKLAAVNTALSALADARSALEEATNTKKAALRDFETAVRSVVRRIQANPAVTDAQRGALGITVPDRTPTAPAVPTEKPNLRIELISNQRHSIVFYGDTAVRYGKPAGAAAIELVRCVGETPPTTDAGWQPLGFDKASPLTVTYDSADVGKRIWYRARWVNEAGQPGPWSDPISALVTG